MKDRKTEIKWALIFVVVMLLWMTFEKLIGLHDEHIDKHASYTNLVAVPAVLIYVLALLDKKKNFYNGVISFRQSFISGMIMTVIITVLSPLTQYITSTVISPDYFTNAIDYSVSQGKLSQPEAERYFNMRSYILMGSLGALVMGTITSAIVSVFVRNNRRKISDL